MGLFSDLMDKVFGKDEDGAKTETGASEAAAPEVTIEAAQEVATEESAAQAAPEALSQVDVVNLLNGKVEAHAENLDWQKSIVDLLKLMEMDSSYGTRKEMALELGYTEQQIEDDGSGEMNMWLHKQVMQQIAQNGGNVPEELYA